MSIHISIKNSLIKQLKNSFKDFDIFAEEINNTSNSTKNPNFLFIEIIPISTETSSNYHTKRTILITIEGHTETKKNHDYLEMLDKIDMLIRPVFKFDDRAITINRANGKIIDRQLLYTFEINFIDNNKYNKLDNNNLDIMQNLDIKNI